MEEKTNVMRILEQKKIKYTAHSYINTDAVSGVDVAAALNENPDKVFKTLVTVAKSGKNYVFVIPVAKELDLKKAARAVGEHEAENFDTIIFSAGKIGYQVEMPLSSLSKIIRYQTADVVIEENVNE